MGHNNCHSDVEGSSTPVSPAPQTSEPHAHVSIEGYRGPLPSPTTIRQYEEIVPNAGERLFHIWEIQVKHRLECEKELIECEKTAIDNEFRLNSRSQIAGILLTIFMVFSAILAAWWGMETVAICFAGFPVAAITLINLGVRFFGNKSDPNQISKE